MGDEGRVRRIGAHCLRAEVCSPGFDGLRSYNSQNGFQAWPVD